MAKLSKRMQAVRAGIEKGRVYGAEEAFVVLQGLSKVKFMENVDVSVNLGIDPRKSDQVVRGATVLPNGIGKQVRVAVFCQGAAADAAALVAQMSDAELEGVLRTMDVAKAGDLIGALPKARGAALSKRLLAPPAKP